MFNNTIKKEFLTFNNDQVISVICVVYNGERTINKTIESLISQSYRHVEIILVDGQSTDNTLSIINRYKENIDVLITEKDDGIYHAMNKGILAASGEWIYFIGCDDVLFNKEVFAEFINTLNHNTESLLYYGDVVLKKSGKRYGGEFMSKRIIQENICHQAMFFHRSIFKNIGLYSDKYKILADWEFNIRCFGNSDINPQYINLIVAEYNELGKSSSVEDKKFNAEFIKIIYRNLPFYYSIIFLFHKVYKRFIIKYE